MIRKKDIISTLEKDFTISKELATEIVDNIIKQIRDELITWNDVIIQDLFTLSVKKAMGRNIVIPSNWQLYEAKEYRKLKCSFAINFRNEVKNYKR